MGEQPNGTPPGQWTPRQDINTRVLFERIDRLEDDLEKQLKGHVTWQGLAGSIIALLGLVWLLTAPARDGAIAAKLETREQVKELKEETAEKLEKFDAKIERVDVKVDGIYRFVVEQQPRGAVKAEVKRRTE